MEKIIIGLIAGGVAVILLIAVVIFIICYRRCTRYDYTPLLEDLALPAKLRREREQERNSVREEALINCQFYLRSHSGRYSYMGYFPNMGSRLEKHWFAVRKMRQTKDLVLNVWKKSLQCPVPFDAVTQKTMKELFRAILHPYIWPVLDLDLSAEQSIVITVQSYQKGGSLKDHIYGVRPNNYVEDKYGLGGSPLPNKQLKLYGLQVLQALLYLEEQGIPFHGNVQSGNVILEGRTCRLAGYENIFLGYTSQIHHVLEKYIKEDVQSFDSLSFGHMMYEMSAGQTLNQAFPDRIQLQKCKELGVKELLEYIFDVNGDYPSIRNISEHEFFVGVRLKHLENNPPKQVQVTPAMKSIFKSIKRGKPAKSKGRNPSSRSKRKVSYGSVESRTTNNTSFPNRSLKTSHIQEAAAQPPPPPPPPPITESAQNMDGGGSVPTLDRSSLLSQIRQGTTLKSVSDPVV